MAFGGSIFVLIRLSPPTLTTIDYAAAPWHFLYFFPLPHGHGSLRPTLGSSRRTVFTAASSPPVRAGLGPPRSPPEPKKPPDDSDALSVTGDARLAGGCRSVGAASAAGAGLSQNR